MLQKRNEKPTAFGVTPVVPVPELVVKCLLVRDCTFQGSTHILRAFYSADIGMITDTNSDLSSTCVVLALVAGRLNCQP